ncbi:MAG: sugar ABC transporter substrate-binding protein, partial [Blastocatellia bacterium]
MKNLNRWFSFLLIGVALLAGCNQSSAPPASGSGGKPRVALVMKSLANEFFKTMQDGAEAHQRAHAADYDLIAGGTKDELDVSRQVELVEQMITRET